LSRRRQGAGRYGGLHEPVDGRFARGEQQADQRQQQHEQGKTHRGRGHEGRGRGRQDDEQEAGRQGQGQPAWQVAPDLRAQRQSKVGGDAFAGPGRGRATEEQPAQAQPGGSSQDQQAQGQQPLACVGQPPVRLQREQLHEGGEPLARFGEIGPDHGPGVGALCEQAAGQQALLALGQGIGEALGLHAQQAATGEGLFVGAALLGEFTALACHLGRLALAGLPQGFEGGVDLLDALLGRGYALLRLGAQGAGLAQGVADRLGIGGLRVDRQQALFDRFQAAGGLARPFRRGGLLRQGGQRPQQGEDQQPEQRPVSPGVKLPPVGRVGGGAHGGLSRFFLVVVVIFQALTPPIKYNTRPSFYAPRNVP